MSVGRWPTFAVGDVFRVLGGGTPSTQIPEYWEGEIPWITSADLRDNGSIVPRRFVSELAVTNSAANVVPGDSLIVATRVGLGKIGLTERPTAYSQDCQGLVLDTDEIDPNFGLLQLRQLVRHFKFVSRGTTIAGVTKKQLLGLPFRLPDLGEQRRVVRELDQRMTLIASTEASLRDNRLRLEAFRTAYLGARFLEGDWPTRDLATIGTIHVGATPSRARPEYWGDGIAWVSSGEVRFGRIAETRETITQRALAESSVTLHPPGTVLLAMIGEGKTRGQSAILDIVATTNQNVAAIRIEEPAILPEWIFYGLMASYSRTRTMGSGNNQPALNKARVGAISLPIPPRESQLRLTEQAARTLSILDNLGASLGAALTRSRSLRDRIVDGALGLDGGERSQT